jgi:hypothetical protein
VDGLKSSPANSPPRGKYWRSPWRKNLGVRFWSLGKSGGKSDSLTFGLLVRNTMISCGSLLTPNQFSDKEEELCFTLFDHLMFDLAEKSQPMPGIQCQVGRANIVFCLREDSTTRKEAIKRDVLYGGFLKWGYPNSWLVYDEKKYPNG